MSVRPRVQEGRSRSEEVIYVAGHDAAEIMLREGATHGLSLFYEATPDHKDILVDIEQPVR